MTGEEKQKLEQDYQYLLILLDFYVKNRESITSKNDQEYQAHIDSILDEMNRIKELLKKDDDK